MYSPVSPLFLLLFFGTLWLGKQICRWKNKLNKAEWSNESALKPPSAEFLDARAKMQSIIDARRDLLRSTMMIRTDNPDAIKELSKWMPGQKVTVDLLAGTIKTDSSAPIRVMMPGVTSQLYDAVTSGADVEYYFTTAKDPERYKDVSKSLPDNSFSAEVIAFCTLPGQIWAPPSLSLDWDEGVEPYRL